MLTVSLVRQWALTLIVLICVSTTATYAAETSYQLYVSVSGEKKIARYEMSPTTGALTMKGTTTVEGAPGSLAVDPSRQYLYAALRSSKSIASFRIDRKTGDLKLVGTSPSVDNAVYVATDRTGKFLLTAYYGAGKVAIYPIKNGVVQGEPTQTLDAEKNPHSIQIDRANRFVYVPCTGADTILQFRFDAKTGKLTPLAQAKVTTKEGAGPRHFYFHPKLDSVVYVVNEKNSSVTVYQRDANEGELKAIQTLPTLPKDFDKRNTCADIEVTPDGKFVYASNRGHDSLATYQVDPKNGKLIAAGQAPTEKTPREFNVDPTGRFVFSAGQGSGKMIAYRINATTGKLTPLKTYDVGKSPAWVLVVPLSRD